jgi:GNAT superfamily N-acetyltransferase
VLPLGPPDRPADEAVAAVAAWYAGRGREPRAAVPRPGADDPDAGVLLEAAAAFTAAGWRPIEGAGAHVLTAPTAELRAPVDGPPDGLRLELLAEPDAGWLDRYHYRGQPLPPVGRALLLSAPEQVFVAVRDGDRTAAVARGSLAAGWAGLTAVEVGEDYRRRGLARLLLRAVADWAWSRGASATYVQVGETNDAALTLYRSAGFTPHHFYAYLTRSP